MAKYIEREKVLGVINELQGVCATEVPKNKADIYNDVFEEVYGEMQRIPAADVQEVKHGFWEEGKVRGQFALICSECECDAGVIYDYDYCPNCGAKMDGKDGESNDKL